MLISDNEMWLPAVGFDTYQVSDLGRVRNVYTERVLRPGTHPLGYLQVCLIRDGRKCGRYVHRLVALAFCEIFTTGLEVDHLDGDKTNNRAANLEWVTRSENISRSRSR